VSPASARKASHSFWRAWLMSALATIVVLLLAARAGAQSIAASAVYGQGGNFTTGLASKGGVSASSLNDPISVCGCCFTLGVLAYSPRFRWAPMDFSTSARALATAACRIPQARQFSITAQQTKHHTALHCTSLHCTLHNTALHSTTTTRHYSTPLHSTPLHLHSPPLPSTPLHDTALHSATLLYTTLHSTALHYDTNT
jgi:hypothetical protein